MIPPNLTNAEVGIFLQAVGRQMTSRDLCFEAALDGASALEMQNDIVGMLHADGDDDCQERAAQLIDLTGHEAVNFIEGFPNEAD